MARATDERSPVGASRSHVRRKSLPAPCAFVNGMVILISPEDLNRRRTFYKDSLHKLIVRFLLHSGRNRVALDGDGPLFMQEQIGTSNRGVPGRPIPFL